MDRSIFSNEPGFCPECGTLLPLLLDTGNVTCIRCRTVFPPEVSIRWEDLDIGGVIMLKGTLQKLDVLMRTGLWEHGIEWPDSDERGEFLMPQICLQPERKYVIHFNSIPMKKDVKNFNEGNKDGPVVERICPKCNNDKMSYAAIQLRSADEGQTVFFTCTKCGFKENENS